MESSEKTAWLSILTNTLLVGIKTAVALASGSVAVVADTIHSLTDVVSAVVILIGIKIARRPARGFPYGLYKVENLVALLTSILILFAGYEILKAVFFGESRPLPKNIPFSIIGLCATLIITWLFSRYELKKGEETGSPSLIADARHIWTDMLSTLVILAAFLGSALGFGLDTFAAVIVVFFIARSAMTIVVDSVRVLLDASLDFATITTIRETVLADPRVVEINQLWARNAGRYKFVELDLVLRINDLERGHRVTEEIENRVKLEIPQVDRVLIHFQPQGKNEGGHCPSPLRRPSNHFSALGRSAFFPPGHSAKASPHHHRRPARRESLSGRKKGQGHQSGSMAPGKRSDCTDISAGTVGKRTRVCFWQQWG